MTIYPTQEQQAIIKVVAKGKILKVAALAGTDKTTTLIMIARSYPEKKGLYMAYNKTLQLDAKKKFPDWIDCRTVHSLAYGIVGHQFNEQLPKRISSEELIIELGIEDIDSGIQIEGESLIFTASKLLGWTRDLVSYFTFSSKESIESEAVSRLIESELPKVFMELDSEGTFYQDKQLEVDALYTTLTDSLLRYACDLWEKQSDLYHPSVPCDHDTYLKLYQLSKPVIEDYDYIMLDEAQDANPCIIDILANQKVQVIYVGDEYQQMYSYRGTLNAMKKVEAETYFLTQSFRFGEAIAEEANVILKELKSPSLLKGLPSIISSVGEVELPYTYIARSNLRLFEVCLEKIEAGYHCCFLGNLREMTQLIRSAYSLWCKRVEWVKDSRITPFADWQELVTYSKEHDAHELLVAIHFIQKYSGEVIEKLNMIQSEAKHKEWEADIIFTTAHKAKGREWDNVILANDFNIKTDAEKNIYYVALTRAKLKLQYTFLNLR